MAVAYADDPGDFPAQRDRLAQKLFAPEKLDLQVHEDDAPYEVTSEQPSPDGKDDAQCFGIEVVPSGEASGDEEYGLDTPDGNYDEAEALTNEMEEENLLKKEVIRIKDTILDSYQSEREIFDSLQRLRLMQLPFDVLKETEIGKPVKRLHKHSSGRVRSLAKELVSEWRDIAEQWYRSVEDATAAATAGKLASNSPANGEEHGLPSPPMDEGAFLAARTASLEMSQLFDFMDDKTCAGSSKPKTTLDSTQPVLLKKSTNHIDETHDLQPSRKPAGHHISPGRNNNEPDARKVKDRLSVTNSNGHSNRERDKRIVDGSDRQRESSGHVERKSQKETLDKRMESGSSRRTQTSRLSTNNPVSDAPQLDEKILASKRKLQENYQQAENAKRQRTIQVMELQDLPKGGPKRAKASQMINGRPASQHRLPASGRR